MVSDAVTMLVGKARQRQKPLRFELHRPPESYGGEFWHVLEVFITCGNYLPQGFNF